MAKTQKHDQQAQTASTTPNFNQIRVSVIEKDSLRAMATVKVLDAIYLTGIRVIEGKNGLFISMPSKKTAAGDYSDIFFPASKAMRDELQALVLEAYNKELELLKAQA